MQGNEQPQVCSVSVSESNAKLYGMAIIDHTGIHFLCDTGADTILSKIGFESIKRSNKDTCLAKYIGSQVTSATGFKEILRIYEAKEEAHVAAGNVGLTVNNIAQKDAHPPISEPVISTFNKIVRAILLKDNNSNVVVVALIENWVCFLVTHKFTQYLMTTIKLGKCFRFMDYVESSVNHVVS